MCIPMQLTCNGFPHCDDNSDEDPNLCASKRSVSCDFEDAYLCGYETPPLIGLAWKRKTASDTEDISFQGPGADASGSLNGYYMIFNSRLGQVGDRMQLISPLITITQPTQLQFYYYMSSKQSNGGSLLQLFQVSRLGLRVQLLFESNANVDSSWQPVLLCIPSGSYSLVFEGTMGTPLISDIAIDEIKVSTNKPSCTGATKTTTTANSGSPSVNCTFAGSSSCGYTLVSSTSNLQLSYSFNGQTIQQNPADVCKAVFQDMTGYIVFIDYYYWRCSSSIGEIRALNGSVITITFNTISLSDNYDDESVQVQYFDDLKQNWTTHVIIRGSIRPQKISMKTIALRLVYGKRYGYYSNDYYQVKFNVTYKISLPKSASLLLVMRMKTGSDVGTTSLYVQTIKLMSPAFQLTHTRSSCLVIRMKALAQLTVTLRSVNITTTSSSITDSTGYEERLLHRNIQPMFPDSFFTLRRNIGGHLGVEGKEFAIVFESKGQQLNGDIVIIGEIQLQENQCEYFSSDVTWNGFCDFSSTDGSTCPTADQSDSGYSWAPAYQYSDMGYLIVGLRSEFSGFNRDEVSKLLTPPYTSTEDNPCLMVSAILSSPNIRLDFSLLSTNTTDPLTTDPLTTDPRTTDPLPAPQVVQTAFLNGSEVLQLYYIRLPVGVPVMMEIKASQFYVQVVEYSNVLLRRIEPNSCQFPQPVNTPVESINCTRYLSSCGYSFGTDWRIIYMWLDGTLIEVLEWGQTTGNTQSTFNPSNYTSMQNLAMTPNIDTDRSVLLTFKISSSEVAATRSKTSLSLVIYQTSSFGLLSSKLAKYSDLRNVATVQLCLPSGRFQLAFLAYTNAYSVSSRIQLSQFQLTDTECSPPNQISYLCSDDNVCMSRVISPSPQFVWKYSCGHYDRREGDDVLIFVFDLRGTIDISEVDRVTTIYLNSPGPFEASLHVTMATDKRGCKDYSSSCADMGVRGEDGQVVDWLNFTLFPSSLWNSTDVLQIYLSAEVARCINVITYSVNRNDSTQGYSLLLVRNMKSDVAQSDNLTAQWTSDVLSVTTADADADADANICVAVDLILPSIVQAKLFEESLNGTVSNRSVFASGGATDDQIRGEFQVSLDRDAARIQIAFFFNENVTINNISLQFGSCDRNDASLTTTNLSSCDFKNFDSCGYHDSSQQESRWMATASIQVTDSTDIGRQQRDCVSDTDGRSYVGRQSVTFTGRTCLPWYSQEYVVHPYDDVAYFPDSSLDVGQTGRKEVLLEDVSNYCRNPSFDGTYEIWPWCYGDGPKYRKEYCSTPLCQVYFMKVVFGRNLDSARLLSPPTRFNGSVCLQFQYRLSHPKIILSVGLSNSLSTQLELNYRLQTNASDWNAANVTLNDTDDDGEVQQVEFVAEKIGFTVGLEYAAIRNIVVITSSSCRQPDPNKDMLLLLQQELKEPYIGNRLPIDSYKKLVLADVSQYTMGDITRFAGHQQKDLIYACAWNNAMCIESDFRSELTDMGLCYNFNADENNILISNNTGSKYGLHLILNVEQYENVPKYDSNTGIKIHLRNYDDIPQVKDSGFTVAPGYQTLAPLDFLTVENLAPPWGRCLSKNYEFFNSTDRYTTAKCQLECQTRSIMAHCGCKAINMPGPGEICHLDTHLSCEESWNDQGTCNNCPDECHVYSYSSALSFSQVSSSSLASVLWSLESVRERYWHSLEIGHRVGDTELQQTLSALQSLIDSHRQLTTLINRNVINRSTSTTDLVLKTLAKLMEITGIDIDSSQRFLDDYQGCYKERASSTVQTFTGQLIHLNDQLGNWKSSTGYMMSDEQSTQLRNLLTQTTTAISTANDTLRSNNWWPYCPANPMEKTCSSLVHAVVDRIAVIINRIPTEDCFTDCNPLNEIEDNLSDVQLNISKIVSCVSQYGDLLVTFQSFLDSVDRTVSSVDSTVAGRTLNTLEMDRSWLETIKVAYLNGSRTKRWLSGSFLRESSNRLSLNVGSALSGIESTVLPDVTSVISAIETRTISVYSQLVVYLYKMLAAMPVDDANVNDFAKRHLLMWRSPYPMLQDKDLAGYHLSSDQIDQALGASISLTSLSNGSGNLIPTIVRSFTTSLRQTLTNVQSELRSAQQTVVNSIAAFNQQMTTFNDSTIIGDGFVRNNFLEIDIFYGEMKYRTIKQTTGYDIVQFLSDFGGCFGLFLGGSILSVFEFLDLVIYNLFVKMSTRKPKTRINVRPPPKGVPQPPGGVPHHPTGTPNSPGIPQGLLRPKSGFKVHPLTEIEDSFGLESIRI